MIRWRSFFVGPIEDGNSKGAQFVGRSRQERVHAVQAQVFRTQWAACGTEFIDDAMDKFDRLDAYFARGNSVPGVVRMLADEISGDLDEDAAHKIDAHDDVTSS